LSPEESKNRQLKLELKDAQMERDILKKVIGMFSKTGRNSMDLQKRVVQIVKLPISFIMEIKLRIFINKASS